MLTLRAALFLLAVSTLASQAPAQVSTLEQQMAVWDGLLTAARGNPASLAAKVEAFVPQYGNWCGMQATAPNAPAIDFVDAACRAHDLSPGYSSAKPTLSQVVQADRQFIGTLALTQASTPYGELFRNAAIEVFEAKTTYEQANRVSLFTPCSDCPPVP
jgi:hypothetical protein